MIECCLDIDIINPEIIDILLAQGVLHKDILKFDFNSLLEYGVDENHKMIDFLVSRDFFIPAYFSKKLRKDG